MTNPFFEHPILNSPYERPQHAKHYQEKAVKAAIEEARK